MFLQDVFTVLAFSLAAVQVSSILCPLLGCPAQDWGVPGHKMFPLWRILCRPRHFVARGDIFMAANPTVAPHQETWVTQNLQQNLVRFPN